MCSPAAFAFRFLSFFVRLAAAPRIFLALCFLRLVSTVFEWLIGSPVDQLLDCLSV